jgi:hypothetical protein
VTRSGTHQNRGGTTSFRCGGCGAASQFAHREQQYGPLVHSFLDKHGQCGNAVEITTGFRELHDPMCG